MPNAAPCLPSPFVAVSTTPVSFADTEQFMATTDALLELTKMPAVKEEESEDDHVSTVQHHISRTVEAAMISVSNLLSKHPELLKRFLLGAACILHNTEGGAEVPPPPPPPESRICLTPEYLTLQTEIGGQCSL
jgi:hypothetical protein